RMTGRLTAAARVVLDFLNVRDDCVQSCGHLLVSVGSVECGVSSVGGKVFHYVRLVAVAAEKRVQFLSRNACQDGGIGNFVAIEMQNGQNCAIANGIEELI